LQLLWRKILDAPFGASADSAYPEAGNDNGTVNGIVTAGLEDDFLLTCQRVKNVKQDQAKLAGLWKTISEFADDPAVYIKAETTYSVAENTHKNWPQPIRGTFNPRGQSRRNATSSPPTESRDRRHDARRSQNDLSRYTELSRTKANICRARRLVQLDEIPGTRDELIREISERHRRAEKALERAVFKRHGI